VVAAANEDLSQLTAARRFRQDLFFRLDVLRLELPPLRERQADIPVLARHFLSQQQQTGRARSFSAEALKRLASYHWPGNVRELLNVVQRANVFSQGRQIDACEIILPQTAMPSAQDFRRARVESIENFERTFVCELLQRHQGNVTHAAKEAGKERRAFGRLVKKYGLRASARAAGQN
jgi:DNA-binding NtrC family response regulator